MTSEQKSPKNDETQSTLQLSADERQKIWEEIELAREFDHIEQMHEIKEWRREQVAKAPIVVALLRKYIPPEHLQAVEELLSYGYGCDCVREIINPWHARWSASLTEPTDDA